MNNNQDTSNLTSTIVKSSLIMKEKGYYPSTSTKYGFTIQPETKPKSSGGK